MISIPFTCKPGILSPRVKYSVLEEDRSADVPIPYLLFSQIKIAGRFHSFACHPTSSLEKHEKKSQETDHVIRLKDLTLITRSISIHGKRSVLLTQIFLCKRDACADGNLSAHDTVPAKKGRSEDVHGPAFAAGHARLASEELSNDALDGTTTEKRKGMAPVSGDDAVVLVYAMFEPNRHCFLHSSLSEKNRKKGKTRGTHLANGEMAEAADELDFVECISGHLHASS